MMTVNEMDPLQLLIGFHSKIVLVDDNAKTHAPRSMVLIEPKPSPCRWQSSPVSVRKPGILTESTVTSTTTSTTTTKTTTSTAMKNHLTGRGATKRGGLPPGAMTSLKSLVTPLHCQHRQRTVPILPLHHDDDDDDDGDDNGDDNDDVTSQRHHHHHHHHHHQLNAKVSNASELLSEYLRVATEELCLDYHGHLGNDDDGETVTTASAMTISSHSTNESSPSCQSLLSSSSSSSSSSTTTGTTRHSHNSLTSNVRKPVRTTSSKSLTRNVKKPVRQRSREDLLCDLVQVMM